VASPFVAVSPAASGHAAPPAGVLALSTLLVAVPWLWPWTTGPLPNMLPLLASWACLLLLAPLLAWTGHPATALRAVLPSALLAAALVSAVLGLLQWFGVAPASGWISPAGLGEAYGNLRQRNHFASLMSLGLATLVWTAAPWPRRTVLAAAVLLACASAASASRTGLLQLLALSVLAVSWPGQRRQRALVCAVAVTAYFAATWLLPIFLQHWRGVEALNVLNRAVADLGCSSRRVLWSNALHLVAQRPWAGWGAGELDYAHFMTLYPGARFCDILDNAHNLPLHIAVEFGVPAALAIVATAALLVWRARPWQEMDPARQLAWAALLVIGLHSLLEYPLWYGPFQLAFLLAIAILAPGLPAAPRWRTPLTLACLALLAWLAWTASRYDLVSDAYRPPEERRAWTRADPVAALRGAWLFEDQMLFAQLSLTPVSRANAKQVHEMAARLLHFSPEPTVIEKLMDSALLLGRNDELALLAVRFEAAFPDRYKAWRAAHGLPPIATPRARE
jgi:O-antigen ligase